jgi:EmrB/QacA subfamily drug resistance transporter
VSRRRKDLALVLLCAGSFLGVVDTTIVAIALPSVRRDLGFSATDAQWILNGYALVFGGLLLLLGRCGDLYGRRRLFMAGLALFGVASLAAGLAWEPWVLIVARCVQGAGAAALVPASLSLVTTTFAGGEERNRALGVYGAMAALGFVVGMVLGGLLTEFLGWRWVFFVGVPVALAVLSLAPAAVPESRDEGASRVLDVPGAAMATLGLASLIYAISEVPKNGWASPLTLSLAALGALLLGGFVVAERRSEAPLVPLGVFSERTLAVPNAAVILQSMIGIAWLYVLTLYFQDALGHGPLQTGFLFAPMTLASVVAAPVAGRLVTRLGVKPTTALGLVLVAAGLLLMALMSTEGGILLVLSGMVVGEVGFMLSSVSLTIAASGALSEDKRGLAAGVLNTSVQLGNAFGLGVVATVVAAATAALGGETIGVEAMVGGFRWGLMSCVGIVVLALLVVLVGLRGRKPSEADVHVGDARRSGPRR